MLKTTVNVSTQHDTNRDVYSSARVSHRVLMCLWVALLSQILLITPFPAVAAVTNCGPQSPTLDPIIFCDYFSGSTLNSTIWTAEGDSVTVHDGIADIQQNVQDKGATLTASFAPLKKLRFEVMHKLHADGVFMGAISLFSTDAANGGFSLIWPNYQQLQPTSGFCYDMTTVVLRANFDSCFAVSPLQSSSYYDRWMVSVVEVDNETGQIAVDFGGDGSSEITATLPLAYRFPVFKIQFGAGGWGTGHSHQIDYVRISGIAADSSPPTVPTGIKTASSQTPGMITLTWGAAQDNEAVTGYKIYSDGILVASVGNVTTYGPLNQTALGYNVAACDGTGNCSPQSEGTALPPPGSVFNATPESGVAAAGYYHSLIIKSDGTLLSWGKNESGQLGIGSMVSRTTPTVVGIGFSAVAAGLLHSAAIKSDGSLWTWGGNTNGQLGDGTTTARNVPAKIGSDFVSVAVGQYHTLAIKADGTLWAWGANNYGQLGDGTTIQRTSRVLIGSNFRFVSAGANFSLAIKTDGSLWAWGQNDPFGSLGDFTSTNRLSPVSIGARYSTVSGGGSFTLAIKTDGALWGWGNNWYGMLGNGEGGVEHNDPRQVGFGYSKISAGGGHVLALTPTGTLWAWGMSLWGAIGDGRGLSYGQMPTNIGDGYVAIAAGAVHSVGLKADGSVWAWGQNTYGQVGDGTLVSMRTRPVLVVNPEANGFLNLQNDSTFEVPRGANVPFFTRASGEVTDRIANVSSAIQFNPEDIGKQGSVYVTAMVPVGTLVAAAPNVPARHNPNVARDATTPGYVLVQLTSTGWQAVINSQLIDLAAGVFNEQLASHTFLVNTDTTHLKGAEFCIGYGTSAPDMAIAARLRPVATIPNGDNSPINVSCTAATVSAVMQPVNCLFNWAEVNYASWFSPRAESLSTGQYFFRRYSQTNAYLAVSSDRFMYLGPLSGDSILDLGATSEWFSNASCL
jgi:alpha-tubulin suppressor-like RCC1 family protein